jgi:trehalose 6-phosphate phosphatase
MFAVILPPFRRTSLLLDLDGTLLDLAATPDAVVVPDGLVVTLRTLGAQLEGAIAVITGRLIETVDALLGDAVTAVAGEHGGAIRFASGAAIERPEAALLPPEWIERGKAVEAAHPGSLFEQKPRGFGIHFRRAPGAGEAIHTALADLVSGSTAFELIPGSFLWEIRPRGVDKGGAVTRLMRRTPFATRLPLFIGDDVTDKDGIRAAQELGGVGLFVPDAFGDAAGVRAWLHEAAAHGEWGDSR